MKLGDTVRWRSHSQGSWLEKVGTIAEVIPALSRPDAEKWPSLFTGAGPGASRNHESYIVTVGKRVYWPRVKRLSVVAEARL